MSVRSCIGQQHLEQYFYKEAKMQEFFFLVSWLPYAIIHYRT